MSSYFSKKNILFLSFGYFLFFSYSSFSSPHEIDDSLSESFTQEKKPIQDQSGEYLVDIPSSLPNISSEYLQKKGDVYFFLKKYKRKSEALKEMWLYHKESISESSHTYIKNVFHT